MILTELVMVGKSKLMPRQVSESGYATITNTWVDWWKCPQVLRKFCKAYNSMHVNDDEWDDLPWITNLVESLTIKVFQLTFKSVSFKSLIKHFCLSRIRHAILQVASDADMT